MKTLDEVIKVMDHVEFCCTNCKLQFDCDEVECFLKDALHYLKEYKANREDPDGDHQRLKKARNLLWEFYQNEPLSWEELKTMEGKPVWVEYLRDGATYDAEWCIVKDIDDDLLHDTEGYGYGRANKYGDGYGVGWQAYRKERS